MRAGAGSRALLPRHRRGSPRRFGWRVALMLALACAGMASPATAQDIPLPQMESIPPPIGWKEVTVELEPDEQAALRTLVGQYRPAEQWALLDWLRYLPVGGRGHMMGRFLKAPPDQQRTFARYLAAIDTQDRSDIAMRTEEIQRGTFEGLLLFLTQTDTKDARFLLSESWPNAEDTPGYEQKSPEEQNQLKNAWSEFERKWGLIGGVTNAEIAPRFSAPWQAELYKSGASASPFTPIEIRRERENYGASLQNYERWHECGGVLIAPRWVLTAAHCIKTPKMGPFLDNRRVRTGTDNIVEGGTTWRIAAVVRHAGYNPKTKVNDIALLNIAPDAITNLGANSRAKVARLPRPGDPPMEIGDDLAVTGWGVTGETAIGSKYRDVMGLPKRAAPVLMIGQLKNVGWARCNGNANFIKSGSTVGRGQICALGADRVDACQGDSGGPLTRKARGVDTVVGLVSYGMGCGIDGSPGVYVDLSAYSAWIKGAMKAVKPGQVHEWSERAAAR